MKERFHQQPIYNSRQTRFSLWRKGSFQAIYVYTAFSLCSFQIIKNQVPADTAKGKSLRMPGIPGISTDHLLDLVPSPKSVKSLPLSVLFVSTVLEIELTGSCMLGECSAFEPQSQPWQFLTSFASVPFSRSPQGKVNYPSLPDEGEDDWPSYLGAATMPSIHHVLIPTSGIHGLMGTWCYMYTHPASILEKQWRKQYKYSK